MGATPDTMISGMGITPWHKIGAIEPGLFTAKVALEKGGLNWQVELHPAFAQVQVGKQTHLVRDEGQFKVIRMDKLTVLGSNITERYNPLQNSDAVDLCEAIAGGHGEAHFETAGVLDGGKRVWFLCSLGEDVTIAGDKINTWFLLTNGHNGKDSLICTMTPVRVVCQNTLAMALKGAKRQFRVKHVGTRTWGEQVADNAAEVLGITREYYTKFEQISNELLAKKVTAKAVDKLIDEILFPIETDASKRGKTMAEKARTELRNIYNTKPDLQNIRGTAFGVFNAVGDYSDHFRIVKGQEEAGKGNKEQQRVVDERLATRAVEDNDLKDTTLSFLLALK